MTESEKLAMLRTLCDDEDITDDMLSTYLQIAGSKILIRAYPYRDDVTVVPEKYAHLQCEIANYLIQRRATEGQLSHSENGTSRSYENGDVPTSLLRQIVPYCGVIK